MKSRILVPLFATSVLFGCQDSKKNESVDQLSKQDKNTESKKMVAQWLGQYEGTTPCMGCLSRCEDCPGMAVDLELKDDMTYVLQRESLSGHNEIETIKGSFVFKDKAQTRLELINAKTRNQIFVDLEQQLLEILDDKSLDHYTTQEDFILEKV